MKKLNLGCGKAWSTYPEYDGVDMADSGQKYVMDVFEFFKTVGKDEAYDEVMAFHFLEHFSQDQLSIIFQNVHRILVPGGIFKIAVPSKESIRAYVLTHKTFWTEETFKALEYDAETSQPLFGAWKVVEVVTNNRPDIHCLLQKI